MHNIIFKMVVTVCLALLQQDAHTQIKNLHDIAHKIPDSLVQQKVIGTDTVTYITESLLKEKYNVVALGTGRFLYIEYMYGYVRGLLIGDDAGRVIASVQYQKKLDNDIKVIMSICSCVGAKPCEEMFAKGLCKYNKICAGNTCICTMPYEIKGRRVEND